ncbi:hypothetical protein [Streptomyces malaysiensis]|uniref:hypothetical protein n=1 Tax=Streptomyces malaysiensis TaxID=92644 RepID=UPI0037216FAF
MARQLKAAHEQRHDAAGAHATARENVIGAVLALDSRNYRLVDLPDGAGRTLVNDAVVRRRKDRQQDGAFEELVQRYALLNDATRALDNSAEESEAAGLFERWAALGRAHPFSPGGRPAEPDVIGPMVAAVMVRAAAEGTGTVEPGHLRWAASELLSAAATTPCAVTAGWDVQNSTADPRTADRSAAMGLTALLSTPALLQQAGTTEEAARAAVLQLAGSACIEVRSLLCDAITRLWDARACAGPGDLLHTAGLEALTEMVATAGLTAQEEDLEIPRQPFRLPDPVETALTQGTPLVDLRLVADAAAAVHLAGASNCPHGRTARQLAEALSEHDRLTWAHQPKVMASGAAGWRRTHDTVTAELALDGDRDRLEEYLTAFEAAPRALAGLLRALADRATSEAQVRELLAMWPDMLDRFASRDNAELGQALLPRPTSGALWTATQARGLIRAWAPLYAARPKLADHLLDVLDTHGLFGGQEVRLALDVLGDGAGAIPMSARRVVPFLARVLSDDIHRMATDAERARYLLDSLAAEGRQEALRIQHFLEESSGLN